MSYEQLQQHDIFLPEEYWGEADLASSTNPWVVLSAGVLAMAAILLMVMGRGGGLTWLGAGAFIVFLYAYAIVSSRAIDAQNREIQRLVEGESEGGSGKLEKEPRRGGPTLQ